MVPFLNILVDFGEGVAPDEISLFYKVIEKRNERVAIGLPAPFSFRADAVEDDVVVVAALDGGIDKTTQLRRGVVDQPGRAIHAGRPSSVYAMVLG